MQEGDVFRQWVDANRLNKNDLAKSMGMSKQSLFQIFNSQKFKGETLAKIEKATGAKWTDMVKGVPAGQVKVNTETKNPASSETGLKDELIVSYKEQIRLLKQELANYNDLRQFITALQLPESLHDLTDKVKAIAGIVEENRVFLKRLASLVSDPDESLNDRGVIKTYGSTRRKAADKSGKKT